MSFEWPMLLLSLLAVPLLVVAYRAQLRRRDRASRRSWPPRDWSPPPRGRAGPAGVTSPPCCCSPP